MDKDARNYGTRHHQLSVSLRHRAGSLHLDVGFSLSTPWTVLFAPSGAGKTTILRAIAGLIRPDAARIVSTLYPGSTNERQQVLVDTASGVCVAPHKRWIRMASADAALFPHQTVLENLTYGSRFLFDSKDDRSPKDRLDEVASVCRIEHLLKKKTAELSRGERQRIALGRSLMAKAGRVLLLDEPFTGLEADLRDSLILDLRTFLANTGTPVLQVTHDVGEVFAARAEVILLADGRVSAQGPPEVVLRKERERMLEMLDALSPPIWS